MFRWPLLSADWQTEIGGDLKTTTGLKDWPTLVRELQDIRAGFTSTDSAVFSARQGAHDDLVLAVAIGVWLSEKMKGGRGGARKLGIQLSSS